MRKKYNSFEEALAARKLAAKKYASTEKRKETDKKYKQTEQGKETAKRASKKYYEKTRIPIEKDFISWDGEGGDIKGVHEYFLFMNDRTGYIINEGGLSTKDCFNFLCEVELEYPNATHVVFGGSYDVNMMLKDIPKKKLQRLHEGKRVDWLCYQLEYRPRKCFILRKYTQGMKHYVKDAQGSYRSTHEVSITLWDVFGFFQSSFLTALGKFFSTQELVELEYVKIVEGKNRRGDFKPEEIDDFIVPYTQLEVKALTRLMERFDAFCIQAAINLNRYDGAGALAGTVLRTKKIKQYYGVTPEQVRLAAQYAYGGGRIEAIKYGHFHQHKKARIHHYDINSAYPSQMIHFPNLANGIWVHRLDNFDFNTSFSLFRIRWDYTHRPISPIYPFFYRDKFGAISYPAIGSNWVWDSELLAALKWNNKLKGKIEIYEQWQFIPNDDVKPYDFVKDMYLSRLQHKKEKNAIEKVEKLTYNSFYGKTVQHLGYESHSTKNPLWRPPYFQLEYGGRTTSGVRAQMFDAAMQAPNFCIAMATDGLWFTREIELDTGENLGQWEYETLKSGTFVQSGVYWVIDEKDEPLQHFRGFDKDNLKEEMVLNAWKNGIREIPVSCTRFITLGSALASDDRFYNKWRTWDTSDRKLQVHPIGANQKRYGVEVDYTPDEKLVPTIPNSDHAKNNEWLGYEMSHPFPLPWNREAFMELLEERIEEEKLIADIEDSYM